MILAPEPTTTANPVKELRVSVFIKQRDQTWLAWHPSKPYWHNHGARLKSEPE